MADNPIAFTERESYDPDTGEEGVLRSEWRLVPYNGSNPLHASIADHFQAAGHFTPSVILEHRYIRRGSIEPWQVFDGYATEHDALLDIDPRATVIDCPALLWIQYDRKRIERERADNLAREHEAQQQLDREREQRKLVHKAWDSLYRSARYRPLCDEWNEFTSRPGAIALKNQLESDREFMKLYTYATRGATTSITKRQAIRACLDYYNFMWRHREPVIAEETKS